MRMICVITAATIALLGALPAAAADKGKERGKNKDKDVVDIQEGVVIRGATELPKLLYIVPWKKADAGDVVMQPGSSIFGDELEPVDREVFQRQVHYHEMMQTQELAQRR